MSSQKLDIPYPDLAEVLYKSKSLDEASQLYKQMLRGTMDIRCSQYAAKLFQIGSTLSTENIKKLEQDFFEYKDHIREWSKKTGIQLSLQRREKDFIGIHAKIRLYLEKGIGLSKINDILGFRIILKTAYPDDMTSIQHCYDVLNETIMFFSLQRQYMLIDAEPRSGTEISSEMVEKYGLTTPKYSMVLNGFENNVKDYVLHPKDNGYQSLHLYISNPLGLVFEIQIRTTYMDIIAEHGSGKHENYKLIKYQGSSLGNIDFSRINMPGFRALPNGEIYDKIGLQTSVDPFNVLD